ncbi:ATP-binding protein [Nonomuraea sp. NPDC047529]|uniref:ATP-binding protein n=1 Tax=Nonomuraea sp. NPDC047529 TaxID=3155623 RepID=UPI00340085AD
MAHSACPAPCRSVEGQRRFIANASHELRTPLAVQRAAIEIGLPEHAGEIRGVSVTGRAEPFTVDGDPGLLKRLVTNLLDNAVRYNHPGGTVEVTLSRGALTVRTTGPHVPQERFGDLFKPSDGSTRPRTGCRARLVDRRSDREGPRGRGASELRPGRRAGDRLALREAVPCPSWRSPTGPNPPPPAGTAAPPGVDVAAAPPQCAAASRTGRATLQGMVVPAAEPAEPRLQQPTAPSWRVPAVPVARGCSETGDE